MPSVHAPPDLGLLIQSRLDDLVLSLSKERDREVAAAWKTVAATP
ncbi:hypothetical protein [Deinococcus planocerae]|nr:hypothetical protein [Deinococcus planocerae]